MKITFLSDNKTENSLCMAEWGLSVMIESQNHKVLFDVGASSLFLENAKNLKLPIDDVEAVVISHGHYDHTEGMEAFCDSNKDAKIFIHKNAIAKSYGTDEKGRIESYNCGIRWSDDFVKSIYDRIVFTENIVSLNDNMTIIGNIEPLKEYPMAETFYRPNHEGRLVPDSMDHEQILVVKEDGGLYVFSGCSHTGMMAIISRVREVFPQERILGIIAGMHLYPLNSSQRRAVVDTICDLGVKRIFPVHCTGMGAILMFREKLGENCVIASAGESYEF